MKNSKRTLGISLVSVTCILLISALLIFNKETSYSLPDDPRVIYGDQRIVPSTIILNESYDAPEEGIDYGTTTPSFPLRLLSDPNIPASTWDSTDSPGGKAVEFTAHVMTLKIDNMTYDGSIPTTEKSRSEHVIQICSNGTQTCAHDDPAWGQSATLHFASEAKDIDGDFGHLSENDIHAWNATDRPTIFIRAFNDEYDDLTHKKAMIYLTLKNGRNVPASIKLFNSYDPQRVYVVDSIVEDDDQRGINIYSRLPVTNGEYPERTASISFPESDGSSDASAVKKFTYSITSMPQVADIKVRVSANPPQQELLSWHTITGDTRCPVATSPLYNTAQKTQNFITGYTRTIPNPWAAIKTLCLKITDNDKHNPTSVIDINLTATSDLSNTDYDAAYGEPGARASLTSPAISIGRIGQAHVHYPQSENKIGIWWDRNPQRTSANVSKTLTVTIEDDDRRQIVTDPRRLRLNKVSKTRGTYALSLGSQPAETTTVRVSPNKRTVQVSKNNGSNYASSQTYTFTTNNWSNPQTVHLRILTSQGNDDYIAYVNNTATGSGEYASAGTSREVVLAVGDIDFPASSPTPTPTQDPAQSIQPHHATQTAEAIIIQTAEAHATQTAEARATQTAVAARTATALAARTATPNAATATAEARATITAAAHATQTAVAATTAEAQATQTAEARTTQTAAAQATQTAQAHATQTAEAAATPTDPQHTQTAIAVQTAQARATITATPSGNRPPSSIRRTPTPTPTPSGAPLTGPHATQTAQAIQTVQAGGVPPTGPQATRTAQARATQTAQAGGVPPTGPQATQTAQARATQTAEAGGVPPTGPQATRTAQARATQTAQAGGVPPTGPQATQTAQARATQTAQAGGTPPTGPQATRTAQARATQTAQAGGVPPTGPQATQTAQARATQTAEAISSPPTGPQATQTAQARATQTAEAGDTPPTGPQATQTAQARATQTAQAGGVPPTGPQATQTAQARATQTAEAISGTPTPGQPTVPEMTATAETRRALDSTATAEAAQGRPGNRITPPGSISATQTAAALQTAVAQQTAIAAANATSTAIALLPATPTQTPTITPTPTVVITGPDFGVTVTPTPAPRRTPTVIPTPDLPANTPPEIRDAIATATAIAIAIIQSNILTQEQAFSGVTPGDLGALAQCEITDVTRGYTPPDTVNVFVKNEEPQTPYSQADWPYPIDQNEDCQDTTAEVLIRDSHTETSDECIIQTGLWTDAYAAADKSSVTQGDITTTNGSLMRTDPVIALNNAHDSGAWQWSARCKKAFTNDLSYTEHLWAVPKSARDTRASQNITEWLPTDQCAFLKAHVTIKGRWGLTVSPDELRSIFEHKDTCEDFPELTILNLTGEDIEIPNGEDETGLLSPITSLISDIANAVKENGLLTSIIAAVTASAGGIGYGTYKWFKRKASASGPESQSEERPDEPDLDVGP